MRWITRSLCPGPLRCLPYPFGVCGPCHSQHCVSWLIVIWRFIRASSLELSLHAGFGIKLAYSIVNMSLHVVLSL